MWNMFRQTQTSMCVIRLPINQEVPLSYEKKVQSGTSKTSWYFRVGDFVFGADTGKKSRYITSTEEIPWKLTENFVLPFSLGKITRTPYKIQSTVYTKEQAQKKAVQQLRIYEQKLLNKGIRIADSRLSVTFDSTNCTVQGTLTVDEKKRKEAEYRIQSGIISVEKQSLEWYTFTQRYF